MYAPLALGVLLALSLQNYNPLYALGGMLIGLFLGETPLYAAMLTAVLYAAVMKLFTSMQKNVSAVIKVLLLLFCQLATVPFTLKAELVSVCFALLSICLSVISGIVFFQTLNMLKSVKKRRALNDWEQCLIALSLTMLLIGVSDLSAFGVSMPVIIILFSSMIAAFARGISGALYGVILSGGLVLYGVADMSLIGSMAFCSILAALLSPMGTYAIVLGYFTGGLLMQTYWSNGLHVINAQNLLLCSIPFLIMPREWLLVIGGYLNSKRLSRQSTALAMRRMQVKTADEMAKTAQICEEIAGIFVPENDENKHKDMLMQWTTHGAMRVCAECEARVLCWKEPIKMGETIMKLIPAFDKGEIPKIEQPIDPQCEHLQDMLSSAYLSYNQALSQQANTVLLSRQYAFVNRQLRGVSEVLNGLAIRIKEDKWVDDRLENELLSALEKRHIPVISVDALYPNEHLLLRISVDLNGTTVMDVQKAVAASLHKPVRLLKVERKGMLGIFEIEEAQQLKASVAVASVPEHRNGISGDATGEYRLAGGRVLYALSDGMGSGEKAHNESAAAIELLFNLYRIGFSRDLVYENVNRLLLTRAGSEMYATLDAVALDLFSKTAEVVKFGAPPTFLLRNGKVVRLSGEALPCGIVDEARPSMIELKIKKNDVFVLFSDGVYDVLGQAAERMIASVKGEENKELANALMKAALKQGQRDDMTVMVIRVA